MGYKEMWGFLNGKINTITSITKTGPFLEFLKDVDTHMIKLLTVEVLGDKPEIITFNVILGSNVPPILAVTICHPNTECTQQWRNQTRSTLRTYTLPTVTYSFDS